MTDPNQLLREYAQSGSETAFQELVTRYVDLVYSVAVRRVDGDADLARDVVQTVFIDLARKAARLRAESSLGGWLHRHTCFVSSNFRRTRQRAAAREHMAMQINDANQNADEAAWAQLAPVLDEAIDELGETDRKAIVLRFYERRDLRSIGSALGTTEGAAQKRISRALEKLRDLLVARGTILGVGALATLLSSRAISGAPAGLAVEVGSKALAAAGGTGLLGIFLAMMTTWQVKLALGAAAAVLTAGILVHTLRSAKESKEPQPTRALRVAGTGTDASGNTATGGPLGTAATAPGGDNVAPTTGPGLHLVILAADSGQPVPNVQLNYRGWQKEHFTRQQFLSNRSGECEVPLPKDVTELEMTSVADGFADTRLAWRPDRGEAIPSTYTLRLIRPVRISGRVVDTDGQPIAEAKVGWNCQENGAAETRPESHNFSWIEVATDSDGRWQINRIAADVLRRLYGSPTHPEYISPPLLMVGETPQAEQQLRDGTQVFRMTRALTVTGTVLDPDGKPFANAAVYSSHIGEGNRREAQSAGDGTFSLTGFKSGKNLISANAPGFAATTREIEISATTPAVTLQLQRGKILPLRLVDKSGQPIAGANVWYNTFRNRVEYDRPTPPPPVQVEFDPKTDADGRAVWTNAPPGELLFSFAKKGFMRQDDVKLTADGAEHVITLSPALVVSGTVVDAATKQPIPKFRIACGWPSPGADGKVQPRFSGIDRYWLDFAGGQFQHSFEEALIGGMKSNPGYMLKFQADGYAPFLSRVIKEDEGEVKLDVALERAADVIVTVLLPNGQPAAGIEVGFVAPGRDLSLTPDGFSRWNGDMGDGLLTTDAQGQVKLPPDDQVQSLVAVGSAGFVQAPISAVRANPQLQLQAWGKIEGSYASGSRAADRKLNLGTLDPGAAGLRFDFTAFQVRTDAQGRFTFPKVPPGTWSLVRLVPESQGPTTMWRHEPIQQIEVRPGETSTLTIGAGTRAVSARFRFPSGFEMQPGLRLFASIHTPFPQPPAEIQNDQAAMMKWGQSPEIRALAQKARQFPLRENKDGTWSAEEVAPGPYVVSVAMFSTQPKPNAKPLVAELPVTIPDGTDPMDLGELALQQAP